MKRVKNYLFGCHNPHLGFLCLLLLGLLVIGPVRADELIHDFQNPPEAARPWV